MATQWSAEKGSAGRDPLEEKVVDYLFKGKENWGMRLIANGRFVMFQLCRSLDEYNFTHAILKEIRNRKHNVDLSSVVRNMAYDKGLDLKVKVQAKQAWAHVARDVLSRLEEP